MQYRRRIKWHLAHKSSAAVPRSRFPAARVANTFSVNALAGSGSVCRKHHHSSNGSVPSQASEALSQVEVEGFKARLAEAEQKLVEAQGAAAAAAARAEASDRERETAEAAAAAAERLRQDTEAEAEVRVIYITLNDVAIVRARYSYTISKNSVYMHSWHVRVVRAHIART